MIVAALLLLSPGEIRVGESVEWLAYDSALILTGVVMDAKSVDGPRGAKFLNVTVKVTEFLKGSRGKTFAFVAQDLIWERIPARCREGRVETLFFLVDSQRYAKDYGGELPSPWVLRTIEQVVISLDGRPEMGLFDANFREHRTKDEILMAARQAVEAARDRDTKSLSVEAPWDSPAWKKLYAGSSVYLVVPLDADTVKRAKSWLRDPNVRPRIDAVRVLEHFRSDEHIGLLKGLLADAGFETSGKTRIYRVRKEAWRVLDAWKVDVEKPVLEEP
ncbi:MAG TPA: hypothetical protein VF950_11330 [Planctomycetota bacterium]